jgi:hypothetical protein
MSWQELFNFSKFSDATIYFAMGCISSVLVSLRLVLLMFFGVGDTHLDVGHDLDIHGDIAHSGDFHLISILSILSFGMGAGWLGLVCRMQWGLGPLASALSASGFGFSLMLLSSFLMFSLRKLNAAGHYDVKHCVGQLGRVYLKVPARGDGHGQVQIDVDGRQKVLDAVSANQEIESFATVKVVDIEAGETLVVVKA